MAAGPTPIMQGQPQVPSAPGHQAKLSFLPGVNSNFAASDTGAAPRWKDCNRVRWSQGFPEKIAGWSYVPLSDPNGIATLYQGAARALHDWSSLDAQFWIAIGTHLKLYLVNSGILSDITPSRASHNLNNPFSVIINSPSVTVIDPGHKANVGDQVQVYSTLAVGGLTLTGYYTVTTVIDPDTYTFNAASNATSNASGGGGVTLQYDISAGLISNGQLLGYGTGLYGEGFYGTPRLSGTGVPARLRTWSLQNFGQDLLASYNDGELYWWAKNTGPNSRAKLLINAPTDIQKILVDPEREFVLAIGCSNLDGTPNGMRIAWCNEGDFTDWLPTPSNSAGGLVLSFGSRLITAIQSNQQMLVWSDTFMYQIPFVGAPNYYGQAPIGTCSIVGPNAAIDSSGTVYFWAFDNFMTYNGTLQVLPCDVWETIFPDFDKTQAEKVYCTTFKNKNEVTWFYPSISGGTGECDKYVTYNTILQCWYYGQMARTAYRDISSALTGSTKFPYAVNNGVLYQQEVGLDEVESAIVTNPVSWFLQSYDMNASEGSYSYPTITGGAANEHVLINQFTPNCSRQSGNINVTLFTKLFPNQATYTQNGPYTFGPANTYVGVRARGSQASLRLDGNALGGDFRFGNFQLFSTQYGKRG